MKTTLLALALALGLAMAPTSTVFAASSAADSLADCLHRNANSTDKESLVQWAYVTLARTDAAKKVQVIKDATIRSVDTKAKGALTTLVVQKCSKPAMQLMLTDPRNGLQDAITGLAKRLIDDEISRRASPLLNLNLGDLMR